jgi:hypothetical protein
MEKTTVYLSLELKRAIKRVATHRGVSEAEVVRDAIRSSVGAARPRPRGGLYDSGESIADEVDRYLEGFGER